VTSVGVYDCALREELAGNARRLIDATTAIIAQIDEDASHPLPLEPAERIVHVVGDLVVDEGRDADVASLRVDHERGWYRRGAVDALAPNDSVQPDE
jgi:hypothetical protein